MTRLNQKNYRIVADESPRNVIDGFIRQGQISREGSWYRINDLDVLNHDFSGMIKKICVNKQETLIQLYS